MAVFQGPSGSSCHLHRELNESRRPCKASLTWNAIPHKASKGHEVRPTDLILSPGRGSYLPKPKKGHVSPLARANTRLAFWPRLFRWELPPQFSPNEGFHRGFR